MIDRHLYPPAAPGPLYLLQTDVTCTVQCSSLSLCSYHQVISKARSRNCSIELRLLDVSCVRSRVSVICFIKRQKNPFLKPLHQTPVLKKKGKLKAIASQNNTFGNSNASAAHFHLKWNFHNCPPLLLNTAYSPIALMVQAVTLKTHLILFTLHGMWGKGKCSQCAPNKLRRNRAPYRSRLPPRRERFQPLRGRTVQVW